MYTARKSGGFSQLWVLFGLVVMAVAMPVASMLVSNNQDNRNRAAGNSICVYDTAIRDVVCIYPTDTPIPPVPTATKVPTPTPSYIPSPAQLNLPSCVLNTPDRCYAGVVYTCICPLVGGVCDWKSTLKPCPTLTLAPTIVVNSCVTNGGQCVGYVSSCASAGLNPVSGTCPNAICCSKPGTGISITPTRIPTYNPANPVPKTCADLSCLPGQIKVNQTATTCICAWSTPSPIRVPTPTVVVSAPGKAGQYTYSKNALMDSLCLSDIVKKYKVSMSAPDFYVAQNDKGGAALCNKGDVWISFLGGGQNTKNQFGNCCMTVTGYNSAINKLGGTVKITLQYSNTEPAFFPQRDIPLVCRIGSAYKSSCIKDSNYSTFIEEIKLQEKDNIRLFGSKYTGYSLSPEGSTTKSCAWMRKNLGVVVYDPGFYCP